MRGGMSTHIKNIDAMCDVRHFFFVVKLATIVLYYESRYDMYRSSAEQKQITWHVARALSAVGSQGMQ